MKLLVIGTGVNWDEQKRDWAKKDVDAIGIDILPAFKPDIVADITNGLPFEDNSFDEIIIEHVLEHIEHKYGDFVMNEIYRVLRRGGIVKIEVPYAWDDIAYEAAGHCRQFVENSFINYYDNPYWQEMGQPKFNKLFLAVINTERSGIKPARVVRCELQKRYD